MIDTEALKAKVLELAMHGLLTKQEPADGDARDLLAQIAKERQKLVKEGKIKKGEPAKPIAKDEIPFEIPNNWIWIRIGEITYNFGPKTPKTDFSYIDVGSLDNKRHALNSNDNVVSFDQAPSRARKIVSYGDVLYSTVRPYLHNICIVDRHFKKEPIASTAFVVMHPYTSILSNYYLFYWVLSPSFDRYTNGNNSKGVVYPAIKESCVLNGAIPLPPLAEQKRIIQRLDDIFSLLDVIRDQQIKYSHDSEVLKEKVLTLAMMGKLTKQLPSDGDARDLLAQIAKERQKLVKEGKIKEEKPAKHIEEKKMPFDIPKNWKWCRLKALIYDIQYGYTASAQDKGNTRLLRITDIQNDTVNWSIVPFCGISDDEFKQYCLKDGDIVIARTGGTIGKSFLIDIVPCASVFASYLIRIALSKLVNHQFCKYLLQSNLYWSQLVAVSNGTGQPNVNAVSLRSLVFPLPPLAEQKRIVEVVDKVFSLLS
jgi:type I restriction enzyme S subunit